MSTVRFLFRGMVNPEPLPAPFDAPIELDVIPRKDEVVEIGERAFDVTGVEHSLQPDGFTTYVHITEWR
jgi:hypothetical protein